MAVQAACATDEARRQAIGQKLRSLREERGIPRERIALALTMGSENLRHYESGRVRITLEMLPVLAEIFDMSVGELATLLLGAVA